MTRNLRSPRRSLSRRTLLRGLGVSAAALPFVPLLESAAGGPEQPPKRFITFFHPHGTIREAWLPTGSADAFVLPEILAPLEPFRDRTLVIDGLSVVPSGPPGGQHTVGPAYVFTGSPMLEGPTFMHDAVGTPHGWNSGPSIDQAIAAVIGTTTPFRSLVLGVQASDAAHPGARISYAAPKFSLTPASDPRFVFDLLFGEQGIDTATAAKRRADRLAVIDNVLPELNALRPKVSVADRTKIDAHLAGVAEMQQQFNNAFACGVPDIGPPILAPNLDDEMAAVADQQLTMLAAAFACGATNVASVMCRVGENDHRTYPFLGFPDSHHDTSHAPDGDTAARGKLVDIYRWYAEQVAGLCARLDAIVEPDGSTVLDNTIILWGSEIGVGNTHAWTNMPFVVLGGGQGALDTGRFLQFPGQNHCRLLTTMAQAMDLDVDAFGGFDDGTGALPGVLA